MTRRVKVSSATVLAVLALFVYSELRGIAALERQRERIAQEPEPPHPDSSGEDPWLFLDALVARGPYWTLRAGTLGREDRQRFDDEVGLAHATAVRAVAEDASYAAADGRIADAVASLDVAFAMHRMLDGLPSGEIMRTIESWDMFRAARLVILHSTTDVDLGPIERALTHFDPRTRMVAGLRDERERVSKMIAMRNHDAFGLERPPFLDRVGAFLVRHQDRAEYLERMTDTIEWVRGDGTVEMPQFDDLSAWTPMSSHAFHFPGMRHEFVVQLEAERELALAAITAHRDGFEAALDMCDARQDPLGAGPFETRIDDDGTLVIWSVGRNGVDDGGDVLDDLVWRIPPRSS